MFAMLCKILIVMNDIFFKRKFLFYPFSVFSYIYVYHVSLDKSEKSDYFKQMYVGFISKIMSKCAH